MCCEGSLVFIMHSRFTEGAASTALHCWWGAEEQDVMLWVHQLPYLLEAQLPPAPSFQNVTHVLKIQKTSQAMKEAPAIGHFVWWLNTLDDGRLQCTLCVSG